jgi:predicted regulator of Ras-like GTPase activity (Roadblock/LC7/MglB family)
MLARRSHTSSYEPGPGAVPQEPMTSRPPEAKRDQSESAFTPILRRIWSSGPAVLAAVFVDMEGECIDYVSSIDPFEAKVSAAHAHVLMDGLRAAPKLGLDEPIAFAITCSERELWARRVSDGYLLVVVLQPGADHLLVHSVLCVAGREFRAEVGAASPSWESATGVLEVIVRAAVGWPYAPAAFSQEGVRVMVTDVLGRWAEPGGASGDELVCFRVRTEDGQELTLVHDPGGDGWLARL